MGDKKDNGLTEIELNNEENFIKKGLSDQYDYKINETESLEKETDEIYNHIFGNGIKDNKIKNSEETKEDLRLELKKIIGNYNIDDYLTLDLDVRDKTDLLAKKVIDTSLLEKVLHRLSSLDSNLKNSFINKLKKKYISADPYERMNLIIDQNLSIIDKSLDNYSSVERNVKSIFKEISLERKETQKKINYCNIIIQNTNELLEQYFFQIENLKSDLQKAYDHSSNGAIITNLEQEQEEIISKMEETKSKMVQSYKIMKHLDLQIDNLLERENYFRDYSININKKIKDLVLLKNFLSVTRKQYELSLKLSSIDNQGKTLDSYLINSSGVINDLLTFNRAADDAFNKMNHYFSNDLDKLLSENVRSPKKRKYDSGNDIEKIKTDAEILITERRKKDFERISYFK